MTGAATAVALVCLLALAYTYLGYPVAIGLCARLAGGRRRGAPAGDPAPAQPPQRPFVSVLLPALDAAAFLPAKLESLLGQDYPPERVEILVYCDGCRDDSVEVARALAAAPAAGGRVQVLVS